MPSHADGTELRSPRQHRGASLRAVLDHIPLSRADRIVCLGDVATLGLAPNQVIETLAEFGCAPSRRAASSARERAGPHYGQIGRHPRDRSTMRTATPPTPQTSSRRRLARILRFSTVIGAGSSG